MKIRELLSDESKWTQGWYARDDKGEQVDSQSDEAACWCLIGAARRCYGKFTIQHDVVLDRIAECVGRRVDEFNDDSLMTFAEIKSVVDRLDV